jgi:hypothetical protein
VFISGLLFFRTGYNIRIYGLYLDGTFISESDDDFGEVTSKQEEFNQEQETSMSCRPSASDSSATT